MYLNCLQDIIVDEVPKYFRLNFWKVLIFLCAKDVNLSYRGLWK